MGHLNCVEKSKVFSGQLYGMISIESKFEKHLMLNNCNIVDVKKLIRFVRGNFGVRGINL